MSNEERINQDIKKLKQEGLLDTNLISDGYHTFGELYDHRITLYIALCRVLANADYSGNWHFEVNPTWRTTAHSDGSVWDGHTSNDVLQRLKEL